MDAAFVIRQGKKERKRERERERERERRMLVWTLRAQSKHGGIFSLNVPYLGLEANYGILALFEYICTYSYNILPYHYLLILHT
jgi:hypothetical protein